MKHDVKGAAGEPTNKKRISLGSPFLYLTLFCSTMVLLFIVLPLYQMVSQPSLASLWETIHDPDDCHPSGYRSTPPAQPR